MKRETTQREELKKYLSKYKKERFALLETKIKENFETKEEFFKLIQLKEETFKRQITEGKLLIDCLFQTKNLLHLTVDEMIFLFFGNTKEE